MQYHEKTIAVCAKGKYDDAPMREAIIALCKTLFHEVLGEEANMYYRKGKDGNIFTLSSSPYQFWIAPKKASKYKSIDTDRQERSELGQIASAIAWKKGFGSDDIRFKIIKNVHEELFGALSNDVAHVAASQDKSPLLDNTKLKRYESFVWEVLDHYKDDFHVNMSKLLSTSSNLNYDELKEKETNEELQMAQARSQLIHKLNEIIDADFRNPLVLIVPENVDPLLVKGLCRVPWNLIISFDSDRKRFFSIIEDEWKGKRPIRIDDVTCDGESETSFIFANGQGTADDKGGQIYKEWKKKYQSLVERALNKIRKGDSSITAICLTDPKDNPVFNKGGVGLLKENDELLIIGKIGSNLRKDLEENFDVNYDWGTTDDTHSGEYNLAMLEIVSVFNEINNSLKDKQESNAISDLTQEDIDRYKEVGIKIICPIPEETPKNTHHISEFYRGKTISENDLYNDYDVRRKIYEEFLENIKSYLKSDQRFIRYICQTPSCGATTFAMR